MIQLCPKCSQCWCKAEERDAIDRAAHDLKGTSLLDFVLGPGFPIIKAAGEALLGDRFHFICPECGAQWSTDTAEDDQTEEYMTDQRVKELKDKYPSMVNAPEQDIRSYIKELQQQQTDPNITEEQIAILYDTIAAAFHLLGEKGKALEAVKNSLSRYEDVNTRILKGIIMGLGRNAQDTYAAMQEVVHYKEEREESPYYTTAQIEEEFLLLQTAYAQDFLSLPPKQRKHLFVCEELTYLPKSFKVLPREEIPTEMKFPEGHPVADTLYVCHPYRTDYYIPNDSYDIKIFRDEIDEYCRIMECLGAKHIEYFDIVDNEAKTSQGNRRNIHGGADYAGSYSVNGSYESEKEKDEYERILEELEKRKDFELPSEPIYPALPCDLIWYPHRIDWHRECESRLAGRLKHSEFILKSSSSRFSSDAERKKIEADLKVLLSSVNGGTEGQKSYSLKTERSHSLKVSVDFWPLSDYQKSNVPAVSLIGDSTNSITE